MKKALLILMLVILIIAGVFFVMNFNSGKVKENPNQQNGLTETDKNMEKEVTLYYANNKYAETGDEAIPKVLPVVKKIKYVPESLYLSVVQQLQNNPGVEGLMSQIPKNAKLLGVEVKDKIVYVNYSSEYLNGGSLQEMLAIDQIVYTLTEFEGITGVQFLVDGSKAENLMGHVDISQPFFKTIEISPEELNLSGMKLNIKRQEFIKTFGQPKGSKFSKNKRKEFLVFEDFKVTISNAKTIEINTSSAKYSTPSGIKVGESKEKVFGKYGEPSSLVVLDSENAEKLTYQIGSEGLIDIWISEEKVSQITIRIQL